MRDNLKVMNFLESTIRQAELAMLEDVERQRKNIIEVLKQETLSLDGYFDQILEMCRKEMAKALLYFDLQKKLNQALEHTSSEALVNAMTEGLQRGEEWNQNYKQKETLTLLVIYSIDANFQKIQRFGNSDDLEKGIQNQSSAITPAHPISDAPITVDSNQRVVESVREETNVTGSNDGEQNKACIEQVKDQIHNSNEDSNITTISKESHGNASNEDSTTWREEEELGGNTCDEVAKESNNEADAAQKLDSSNEGESRDEEGEQTPNLLQGDCVSYDAINVDPNVSGENLSSDHDLQQPSLKIEIKNAENDEAKLEAPQPNLNEKSDSSSKSGDISCQNEEASKVANKDNASQETCGIKCSGPSRRLTENSDEDTKSNDSGTSDQHDEHEASKDQEPETPSSLTKSDGENDPESNELGSSRDSKENASDCSKLEEDDHESLASDSQSNSPQNEEENNESFANEETKIQGEQSPSEKVSSENEGEEEFHHSQTDDQANDGPEDSGPQHEEQKSFNDKQDSSEDNIHEGTSGSDPLAASGETQTANESGTSISRIKHQEDPKEENKDNHQNDGTQDANEDAEDPDGSEGDMGREDGQDRQGEATGCTVELVERSCSEEEGSNEQNCGEDTQRDQETSNPEASITSEEHIAQNHSVQNANEISQDCTNDSSKESDSPKVIDQHDNSKDKDGYYKLWDVEVNTFAGNNPPSQSYQDLSNNGESENEEENKASEEEHKDDEFKSDDITGF